MVFERTGNVRYFSSQRYTAPLGRISLEICICLCEGCLETSLNVFTFQKFRAKQLVLSTKAGTFAFYPNKRMATAEGAVIVTNDDNWTNLTRSLRNQGQDVMPRN